MKLKLDDQGHVVVSNGKPVYVDDQGKDVEFDVEGTVASITRLNGEAKTHRLAKEAAEAKLLTFEGITDPKAAMAALQTVKNLDNKTLVDAGKVEEVRQEAIKATKAEYEPIVAERDQLKTSLYDEKIGGAFARSSLIVGEKAILAIPADLVQARFGKHFSMEGGVVTAKDAAGNPIYSKSNPGALAGFDEALTILVDNYPHKDTILKGTGASGGGSQGGGSGGGNGGAKTMPRAQFDASSPSERMTFSKAGGKVVD